MVERLLITLCVLIALLAGGYWWGKTATDNAWQAKQAKTDKAVAAELAKETQRADLAAASLFTQHLVQEARYDALNATYEDLRRRAPLVVPGPVVVRACVKQPSPEAPRPQPQPATDPARDGGPVLTLAAVRMWNGALTGLDSPAGACGAPGGAEGADAACAQGAGLTLDDAWDNHAVNAKACAEDRQRFQHLIDFLNEK